MDESDVAALASDLGRELLAAIPSYRADQALALAGHLRHAGYPPELITVALTQARLRAQVRPRWGELVDQLILTEAGAQQATRPIVARHRARRYAAAGIRSVTDLGCGIGIDSLAMARAGFTVTAFEADPTTAAAARANATALLLSKQLTVLTMDVTTASQTQLDSDATFADPARRANGRRLLRPHEWLPPLSWVLALEQPNLGVKVAPGLAHQLVPADMEFEVVSVGGDVVEAGLYRGVLRGDTASGRVKRRATLLGPNAGGSSSSAADEWPIASVSDADLNSTPQAGPIGDILYEPDKAVVRAGLVGVVAEQCEGRLIDPRIAYVTSDQLVDTSAATPYEVLDVQRFNLKKLRRSLRERSIGSVTIKKRGFAMTPEQLRQQLKLDSTHHGHTVLVLTRRGSEPIVIEARPVSR